MEFVSLVLQGKNDKKLKSENKKFYRKKEDEMIR